MRTAEKTFQDAVNRAIEDQENAANMVVAFVRFYAEDRERGSSLVDVDLDRAVSYMRERDLANQRKDVYRRALQAVRKANAWTDGWTTPSARIVFSDQAERGQLIPWGD